MLAVFLVARKKAIQFETWTEVCTYRKCFVNPQHVQTVLTVMTANAISCEDSINNHPKQKRHRRKQENNSK